MFIELQMQIQEQDQQLVTQEESTELTKISKDEEIQDSLRRSNLTSEKVKEMRVNIGDFEKAQVKLKSKVATADLEIEKLRKEFASVDKERQRVQLELSKKQEELTLKKAENEAIFRQFNK